MKTTMISASLTEDQYAILQEKAASMGFSSLDSLVTKLLQDYANRGLRRKERSSPEELSPLEQMMGLDGLTEGSEVSGKTSDLKSRLRNQFSTIQGRGHSSKVLEDFFGSL